MVDVFISYKRQERDRCERIANKLRALDLDVWFDARLEAGKSFDREIEESIKKAKAVIVLWSPAAVESEWVRNEATIGKQRDVLVAAQIAPCNLPIAFTNTHFEQLFDVNFADDHPGWLKMLDRIGRLCGRPGIVGFSRALGQAAAPLTAWAQSNPADPLSARMRSMATRLAGMDEVAGDHPKRRGGGSLTTAVVALLALGVGAGGAYFVIPKSAAAGGEIASVAGGLSPEMAVAARLVGKWALPADLGGDCNTPLEVFIGPKTLRLTGSADQLDTVQSVDAEGWLRTRGADGSDYAYKVGDDGRLMMKAGAAIEAQPFEACRT